MESIPLVGSVSSGFGVTGPVAPTGDTGPKLKEATEDFVSVLYAYLFQQMRESGNSGEDGLFSGPHVDMMMGFFDEEVAKKLAKSGQGGGLSEQLYEQLKVHLPEEQDKIKNNNNPVTPLNRGSEPTEVEGLISTTGNTVLPVGEGGAPQMAPGLNPESQAILKEIYKINHRK